MINQSTITYASHTFYVFGSYGELEVDIDTGFVQRYIPEYPDEPEYADIARFDCRTYEVESGLRIMPNDSICIMDFDFWSYSGESYKRDYPELLIYRNEKNIVEPQFICSIITVSSDVK